MKRIQMTVFVAAASLLSAFPVWAAEEAPLSNTARIISGLLPLLVIFGLLYFFLRLGARCAVSSRVRGAFDGGRKTKRSRRDGREPSRAGMRRVDAGALAAYGYAYAWRTNDYGYRNKGPGDPLHASR